MRATTQTRPTFRVTIWHRPTTQPVPWPTPTNLQPETLPTGSEHAIASRNLRSFSVGACYARTDTYPTGVYWVVLSLE